MTSIVPPRRQHPISPYHSTTLYTFLHLPCTAMHCHAQLLAPCLWIGCQCVLLVLSALSEHLDGPDADAVMLDPKTDPPPTNTPNQATTGTALRP